MSVMDDIIYKVIDIMVNVGQSDYRKFRVGETIRYSPSELLGILKQHKYELDPLLPIVPVRHAKWINRRNDDGHNIADCSECGSTIQWFDDDEKPRYCCMCGARMEREEGKQKGEKE